MDPNETLRLIRLIVAEWDNEGTTARAEMAGELITLVGDLDGWLTRGGFLPADWSLTVG